MYTYAVLIWAPATCTDPCNAADARNYSGGTAIFVKDYLGLTYVSEDEPAILDEARLVAGKVSVPGLGSVVVYSGYFVCGAGWDAHNESIANKVTAHAARHGLSWFMGADFNMSPEELVHEDYPASAGAVIKAPEQDTCISPGCTRILDFFIVERNLAEGAFNVCADLEAATRPHRPVTMSFHANLKSATKCVFKTNKKLPCDPLIGPVREPPSFEVPRLLAQEALDCFAAKDFSKGFAAYEAAFAAFADRAEIAVANANDLPQPTWSSRASTPKLMRVPIVPALVNPPHRSLHGRASNLLQKAQEVSAQLTAAWRHGGPLWAKIKGTATNCARKCAAPATDRKFDDGIAAAEDPTVNKLEVAMSKFRSFCGDVVRLASAQLQGSGGGAAGDNWSDYTNCACTAAAIRKECTSITADAKSKDNAAADAKWADWQARDVGGCTCKIYTSPSSHNPRLCTVYLWI